MNVLFIVNSSLSEPILFSQGIPHIQENSKKDINYFVLSFEDKNEIENSDIFKRKFNSAKKELEGHAKIFSINVNLNKRFSAFKIVFYGVIKGLQITKKNRIDIIHGRSNLPSLIGLIIRKFYNVKVIFDNRGLFSDEYYNGHKLRAIIEEKIEKYLLSKVDSIVVVSRMFKRYLVEKYKQYKLENKISVIENSFSEKRFAYSEQLRYKQRKNLFLEDKFIMVYSGSSVNWQRFDLILDTFKVLKKIRKDAYLLVISYDPEIEKIILKNGFDTNDFSVYNLSPYEVNKYLIVGDFGVIFRDDRTRSKVCAPIKLGEYLASGLPILAMNHIGDTDEIINKFRIGVIFENENEIKNKLFEIFKLLDDSEIRIKCRKVAEENLSLKISTTKYLTIYKKLVSSK